MPENCAVLKHIWTNYPECKSHGAIGFKRNFRLNWRKCYTFSAFRGLFCKRAATKELDSHSKKNFNLSWSFVLETDCFLMIAIIMQRKWYLIILWKLLEQSSINDRSKTSVIFFPSWQKVIEKTRSFLLWLLPQSFRFMIMEGVCTTIELSNATRQNFLREIFSYFVKWKIRWSNSQQMMQPFVKITSFSDFSRFGIFNRKWIGVALDAYLDIFGHYLNVRRLFRQFQIFLSKSISSFCLFYMISDAILPRFMV